ncbi:hypothetical protein ATCC90586_001734 [Pythium insidiosum]|nr:hypothetical protein ATCC90586_001734 [Pythium insidiosum]
MMATASADDEVVVETIGRSALVQRLASLRDALGGAAFVAIDTELGGLSLHEDGASLLDTVEQRYRQHVSAVEAFPVVQIGLSCFRWDDAAARFDVQTFQFPIFARGRSSNIDRDRDRDSPLPDRRFLLQAMCLSYIRAHGFDLNEWVDDGISYLNHAEQQQDGAIREWLARPLENEDVYTRFAGDTATPLRLKENDAFLDEMRQLITKLLQPDVNAAAGGKSPPSLEETVHFLQSPYTEHSDGPQARTFERLADSMLVSNLLPIATLQLPGPFPAMYKQEETQQRQKKQRVA